MCRRIDIAGWCLALGLIAAAGVGCTTVPNAWDMKPERVSETACGGYAQVSLENSDRVITGELMAVTASVLYVHDGEGLYSIPVGEIQRTVTVYASTWDGTVAAWMAGGTASTISHGFTLFLSSPVWLIGGAVAVAGEQAAGREFEISPSRKRARFPQGLPPSFEQETRDLDPNRVDSTEAPEMMGGCPPGKLQD